MDSYILNCKLFFKNYKFISVDFVASFEHLNRDITGKLQNGWDNERCATFSANLSKQFQDIGIVDKKRK